VFFSNISGFEGIFLFNYLVRSWWIFVGVIREVSLELKAGGDTRFSFFLDTVGLWFIAVPLAFISGLVWHFAA